MLTAEQAKLWQNIEDFQLDDPEAAFKFSERLARENGWNTEFTLRVITEYKKFIFLCCISESGVTPSDAVDQAWHLHLTFTKSYWIDLCRDTLGREIHHNPTRGGDNEALKYDGFYTGTNKLYADAFGTQPPADIWPPNEARFTELNFQRVNVGRYWLIRKSWIGKAVGAILIVTLMVLMFMHASGNELFVLGLFGFFVLAAAFSYKKEKEGWSSYNRNINGGGCNSTGCGADGDFHSSHHGNHSDHSGHGCHSGCGGHSGCSGCSSSGCSGCGSH